MSSDNGNNSNNYDTFTNSALSDLLSDAFSKNRDEDNTPGKYYYSEIKRAMYEDRPMIIKNSSLSVLQGKMGDRGIREKSKIITRALGDFCSRNMCDSVWYEKVTWSIEREK